MSFGYAANLLLVFIKYQMVRGISARVIRMLNSTPRAFNTRTRSLITVKRNEENQDVFKNDDT